MKSILMASLILAVISIGGVLFQRPDATDAYINSWAFWLQFPLGAMAIFFLQELTGGQWGLTARPVLKMMMKCLWLSPLLFIPLIFKLPQFYPWLLDTVAIQQSSILQFKENFYHSSFFIIRAAIYFLIFLFLNWRAQSSTRSPYMAGWGFFLYSLIMSIASIDWFMSREPEWYSTIYALIWIITQISSSFAVVLLVKYPGFSKPAAIDEQIHRDHGTLFFVFLVSGAYLSFMQFLIIWSGNLPKEVSWYLRRLQGGWDLLILVTICGVLIFPFFLLLNRRFKSDPKLLSILAFAVLIFRFFEISWIILPSSRSHLYFSLWDVISFFGIGGLSTWFFFKQLRTVHET